MNKSQRRRNHKIRKSNYIQAKKYAKKLVYRATKAEKLLFEALYKEGIVFDFQYPIASHKYKYIIDFHIKNIYGKEYAIEVDGSSHDSKRVYDLLRSFHIYHDRGMAVIRFKNEDIYNHIDSVLDRIIELEPACIDNE